MPNLTLRKTFPDSENDYEVLRDGVPVGRIYFAREVAPPAPNWFWSFWTNGPASWQDPADRGYADSLEAAKDEFRTRAGNGVQTEDKG